ncbi:Rrf2 family transcriptional regulator [Arenibacter sp. GZD96]|uniref:RrF2 family transcriptional regulator n=1 Tax=Aurantibrevibacter litoralis TaxID=3106030 RepID=UPI002AFEC99E|nr:Rrf2 family transcriptional regulator [Arenibacter sp. GZD-96]MEA1785229.1 Rrf2 family transcriptional regulator [Arenibacter sp. GZD-96]
MLSNTTKYALKAVLYLAVHSSEDHKILAKDISKPINVPQAYIAKLLQELSRHHVVTSAKGPGGGFYLSAQNRRTPLLTIVGILDGDKRLNSCMLSIHACNENHPCPLHKLVGQTKLNFIKNLEETTIADLVEDIAAQRSFLPV